ncbi:MAG TPA: hypothetical protein VIG51_10170 [Candidatus Baltobacteraceae bacterium]|jgi:hypothetical protein
MDAAERAAYRREHAVVRKTTLQDLDADERDSWAIVSVDDRLAMTHLLYLQWLPWKEPNGTERRLQRSIAHVQRGRR